MRAQKTDSSTRQAQILDHALELIGEHGVSGLSMAELARRVGLVTSGLYRHYESKDALVTAVIERIGQRLEKVLGEIKSQYEDPIEQLEQLHRRQIELIRTNPGIPRLVFADTVFGDDATRRQQLHKIVDRYLDRVAAIIRSGQKAGAIDPTLSPKATAVLFLGLIQPPALLWQMSDGRFDVNRQMRKAWPMFETMIRNASDEAT